MGNLKKAMLLAIAFELPWLLIISLSGSDGPLHDTLLVKVALFVQIVPLTLLGFTWLSLFGHGSPAVGELWMWHTLFLVLGFMLQIAVTAPLFLRLVKQRAAGKEG